MGYDVYRQSCEICRLPVNILTLRSMIIPIVDLCNIDIPKANPSYVTRFKLDSNDKARFFAPQAMAKGDELVLSFGYNSDHLLLHYGKVIEPNPNDCLSLGMSFSERKDDNLIGKRSAFFGKYFLYDRNHFDLIEECLRPSEPFPNRLLFFFYTLMLDESDLEKPDPKRIGLDEDKIIIDYARNSFISMDSLFMNSLDKEKERFSSEKNDKIRSLIHYKILHRNLLKRFIDVYADHYLMLIKEDSL